MVLLCALFVSFFYQLTLGRCPKTSTFSWFLAAPGEEKIMCYSNLGYFFTLRDLLVHSDFPLDQPAQPGTFPCKRTICRTCPHINQSTSIPSPGGQIKITGHFTCTSDNVIYCISCRKCPETVYIGKTGRRLADRFREHRLDVLHKKIDLPVAQHLNSRGHSLEDVRVAVLKSGLVKKDVRLREETRQIFIFQTLAPRGINRDFSFI